MADGACRSPISFEAWYRSPAFFFRCGSSTSRGCSFVRARMPWGNSILVMSQTKAGLVL